MTKNKVVEDIEEIKELPDLSQEDEKWEHNSIDSYQTKNNTSPLVYNKGHLTGRCKSSFLHCISFRLNKI